MQKRLNFYSLFFVIIFISLISRLFYWQIINNEKLSNEAKNQYQKSDVITAPRGDILASDDSWLVARDIGFLAYASLPEIDKDTEKIANQLAPFFVENDGNTEENELLDEVIRLNTLLSKDSVVWVPLKHRLDLETKRNIEALGIKGIGFEQEEDRSYPEGSSAAHLLGFVGKNMEGDDQGYFGLEGYYDLVLSGKPGFLKRESDAKGTPILLGTSKKLDAIEGVSLHTHINKAIQHFVEKRLLEGVERYGAKEGTVIIIRPIDGAILAMSTFPSYDPETYYNFSDDLFRNPAVSSSFEPGSIFKILVMAAALDAGVVEPDTKCDICDGPVKLDKYTINTWDNKYRPESTMIDVLVHSDNVGMVYVSQKLGIDKMYDYLEKFGIGKLTGIDLQGEMTPKLRNKSDLNYVDLATISFGQGVATTPIQIVKAATAIANNGIMVTPRVVDRISAKGWEEDLKTQTGKRVLSQKTAEKMSQMMVESAREGEAKWTHKKGFGVAGKTGTAQIPIKGHYDDEKTIASFIGFAPYDNPKFLMLVTLKEPDSSPWASETAAPLWYDIAEDLFYYFKIQPKN